MPRTLVDWVGNKHRDFNDRVRGTLRRRHISQGELAAYLNISQQALSNRLNGRFDWPLRDVLKVCVFLDMSLGEIL